MKISLDNNTRSQSNCIPTTTGHDHAKSLNSGLHRSPYHVPTTLPYELKQGRSVRVMSSLSSTLSELETSLSSDLSKELGDTVEELCCGVWGEEGFGYTDKEKGRAIKKLVKVS